MEPECGTTGDMVVDGGTGVRLIASDSTVRYCGRLFTPDQIGRIRRLIASEPRANRVRLSRLVCEEFSWRGPGGKMKEMSCRVALLGMHRDGLIALPPPQRGNGNGRTRPRLTSASDPREPVSSPAGDLGDLTLAIVRDEGESRLWNELIERYHYLGYTPLPGAQLRYLVFAGPRLLAALGFGAAAWKVAPRDRFIGWNPEQRKRNLHLVVNNARFLILPWIHCRNLASRILSSACTRIPADWSQRYGYSPVLLETYVEKERFLGTCYKAANWVCVGQTQGRGKLDRHKLSLLPIKDIFLFPLHSRFRDTLRS
jgi:hypothetical protein